MEHSLVQYGDNMENNDSANHTVPSALSVQSMALFGTFLLTLSFVFYLYVIYYMASVKIWKFNPFYLILLSLGVGDNLSIVALMYCYITSVLRKAFLGVFGRTLVGIFLDYNSIVIHWHYFYIAITRCFSILFPIKSNTWFSLRKTGIVCIGIWLLSAAQWGIHGGVMKDIIHFEPLTFSWALSYPDQVIEIPFGIYGLFFNTIAFLCLPFYLVAYFKLRFSSKITNNNQNQIKAQWNLLKLGFLCMIFVIASGNFYQAAVFGWLGEGFWVSCVQSLLHTLLLGVNPFLYINTSSKIRSAVPLPCIKGWIYTAEIGEAHTKKTGKLTHLSRKTNPLPTEDRSSPQRGHASGHLHTHF